MATYDKNKDYTALINQAVKSGDLFAAANYEQSLNSKIAGEGLPYAQQHNYGDYLGSNSMAGNYDKNTDYTAAINKAVSAGDLSSASGLEKMLNAKIVGEGLPYRTSNKYSAAATEKPTYQSQYSDQINGIVNKILNGTYNDFQNSADYQSLAREYAAKGKMAMQDTLGDVSARTGGLASSYAVSAGQQADNGYMQQLQDVARDMYADQRSEQYNQASLLQGLENNNYAKYQDQLGQYNTEQASALNQQQAADQKTQSIAETMAGVGDFSGLKSMGYTDEQIRELTDAYKAAAVAKTAKATKKTGTGGNGNGSSSTPDTSTAPTTTTKSGRIPAGLKSGMARNLWALLQSNSNKELVANRIGVAYEKNAITEAEADILLKLIGG